MSLSLLGALSDSFEAVAEGFAGKPEAGPEVYQSRVAVLIDAVGSASQIHTHDVSPNPVAPQSTPQAPAYPAHILDTTPKPDQSVNGLDADQVRAKLEALHYAQMDPQALALMADRSQA